MYETPEHRAQAAFLAQVVARFFGWSALEAAAAYPFDYAMADQYGMIVKFCECKMRYKTYDPMLLSLEKASAIQRMADMVGVEPMWIVGFDDRKMVGYATIPRATSCTWMHGEYRTTRAEQAKAEPCIPFALEDFELIEPATWL